MSRVMSEVQSPRRIGRSIVALLAGMVTGAVPVIATDAALHATGVFPSPPQPAERCTPAARHGLSRGLRRRRQLPHGLAGAEPAHAARPGAWRPRHSVGNCGGCGDVGPRGRGRARMVSDSPRGAGNTTILAGRSSASQMAGVELERCEGEPALSAVEGTPSRQPAGRRRYGKLRASSARADEGSAPTRFVVATSLLDTSRRFRRCRGSMTLRGSRLGACVAASRPARENGLRKRADTHTAPSRRKSACPSRAARV